MKLGLLAPIDAEAEHAEAMLRNAAELVRQEQKRCHPVVVARECHHRGVFYTFADEQARHDGFLADFLMRS
jgi:hypothetical protein